MGQKSQPEESQALALWCAWLPELRDRAAAGLWTERLERSVARVRDGASALAACRQFGLIGRADPAGQPQRGQDETPFTQVPGLDPVPSIGRGDYSCPARRCPRRAERDGQGRPPTCALFDGQQMRPAALPST